MAALEPEYRKHRHLGPGFRTLDRYIVGKFLGHYIFSILMIIVIVVVFDYVEKIDDFTEMHAPVSAIINDYYLNFIPYFVNQFSGLFTFIAVIFFTSKLAYRTEIVAMLSSGMSFRRLMWPYFIGATIIAGISLVLSLWLIPLTQRDCMLFEQKYIKRRNKEAYDPHIYRQIEPGTFAYIRNFSKTNSVASFFTLESYSDRAIKESLEAADVRFNPQSKRWTASRYTTRKFDEAGNETFTQHRNLDTIINLDVVELGRLNELLNTMNITELKQFMEQQKAKGSDSVRQIEVEHHSRYAGPLGIFILTFMGVALSSRKVRGGTGLHIGMGIALCFAYIMLNRIFEEFAKGGSMPAMLAVWLPNIIFCFIGIYLYRKAPK